MQFQVHVSVLADTQVEKLQVSIESRQALCQKNAYKLRNQQSVLRGLYIDIIENTFTGFLQDERANLNGSECIFLEILNYRF